MLGAQLRESILSDLDDKSYKLHCGQLYDEFYVSLSFQKNLK